MADAPTAFETERLETLRTLLDSASVLLGEIVGDPLFARMARVFSQVPAPDREAILAILEREVQARLTSEVAGELTGLTLRPNPSARLYTRIVADDPRPNPERAVASAVRAIRVVQAAISPMDAEWKSIVGEALRAISPAERDSMAHFVRTLLALVEGSRSAPPAAAAR